jgi:predicted ATPase
MSSSAQPPFISQIRLMDVLSFQDHTVELRRLNVIIGPNGAGKSNLVCALEVLHAAPSSLTKQFSKLGGIGQWIRNSNDVAMIEAHCSVSSIHNLRYRLYLLSLENQPQVADELVENWDLQAGSEAETSKFFWYEGSVARASAVSDSEIDTRKTRSEKIDRSESILSQRRDPGSFPELFELAGSLESICVYNQWTVGPGNVLRGFQQTDLPSTYLLADGSNAALIINKIRMSANRLAFREAMNEVLDDVEVEISIDQTKAQIFLVENGLATSARRLSDGTLRFIFLAAILLQENLPRLIVIEEPELGLHPDLFGAVAKLLRIASEKTQIIVTTHATDLVNEFSDEPEMVLVAERVDGSSSLRRLEKDKLAHWLKDYSLGDAWRVGALGGNRW